MSFDVNTWRNILCIFLHYLPSYFDSAKQLIDIKQLIMQSEPYQMQQDNLTHSFPKNGQNWMKLAITSK